MEIASSDVPKTCERCNSITLHRPSPDGSLHCLACLTSKLQPASATAQPEPGAKYVFTAAQLDTYGQRELAALTEVLEKHDPELVKLVATKIKDKIRYTGAIRDADEFATDFRNAMVKHRRVAGPAIKPSSEPVFIPHARRRIGAGTIILLVAVGVIVAGVVRTALQDGNEKKAVADNAGSAISVSADQLYLDYQANEVSADRIYRDKVLRVSGAVQAIKKDFSDRPYIVLWTKNEFLGVQAHFDDENGLGAVSVSSHVTVRCLGDNVIIGSPMLKHCVLE